MSEPDLDRDVVACLDKLGSDARSLVDLRASVQRAAGERSERDAEVEGRVKALRAALGDGALVTEGTLGEGGMAVVHLATQTSLGRRVAVKKLRPGYDAPEATLKLLREAWITGELEHPNIVPIHDVRADAEGRPEIVLKRIEGVSWADAIHDAALVLERFGVDDPLEHNLDVLSHVCRAVHFAHTRGIVHRDLKPANVMIGAHGEVYLLDWGIAVSLNDDPRGRLPRGPTQTGPAELVGTPAYMAPELLLGLAVSPRTDVYLLGAILYEIVVGAPPHKGETPKEVARSVLRSTPDEPDIEPELRDLLDIALRAMSRRPDDRHASVDELRLAIAEFRDRRTAVRLAREAELRLATLWELAGGGEPEASPVARRRQAYELYGGASFGFREALAIWPGCEAAKVGHRRAIEAMIEIELASGEAVQASELFALLEAPSDELASRVELAMTASLRERRRIESLEALGEDRDAARGATTRRTLVAALGAIWTVAPLVSAWSVDPATGRYPPMIVAPVAALLVLGALAYWGRGELRKTAINRGVVAAIATGVVAQLGVALASPHMGVGDVQARVFMLLVWAIVIAMACVTLDRRLAPGAVVAFGAFATTAAFATTVREVQTAMALTYGAISVNALRIWRPARPDRGETRAP